MAEIKKIKIGNTEHDIHAKTVDNFEIDEAWNVAIGPSAAAATEDTYGPSLAVGGSVESLNDSVAVGIGSNASDSSVVVGLYANASNKSVAIGYTTSCIEESSVAIGCAATTQSAEGIAIGAGAECDGEKSIALGIASEVTGMNSVAIGSGTFAKYANSLTILGTAEGASSIAIGNQAFAYQDDDGYGHNIALGDVAEAEPHSIAIGSLSFSSEKGIAIGSEAMVESTDYENDYGCIAIGNDAYANGDSDKSSIAIGGKAKSYSHNSVAIGQEAQAVDMCVAIGCESHTDSEAVSIGHASGASARGVAVGGSSVAKEDCISIGAYSQAHEGSVTIGYDLYAEESGINIGTGNGSAISSIIIGNSIVGDNDLQNRLAIGRNIDEVRESVIVALNSEDTVLQASPGSVVMGNFRSAYGTIAGYGGVAIGSYFNAVDETEDDGCYGDNPSVGNFGVAVGTNAEANHYSVAIGGNACAEGNTSIAIGCANSEEDQTSARGNYSIAIGNQAYAQEETTIAIGSYANPSHKQDIAIGGSAYTNITVNTTGTPTQTGSVAIGYNAAVYAKLYPGVAIGPGAVVSAPNGIAIGMQAYARSSSNTPSAGMSYIAIGNKATANGLAGGIAIGSAANTTGNGFGIAIGSNAYVTGGTSTACGIAIGNSAKSQAYGVVAIGTSAGVASSSHHYGVVIGHNSLSVAYGTAVGGSANVQTSYGVSLGYNAKCYAYRGLAAGVSACAGLVSGTTSVAASMGSYAIAIGYNVTAGVSGSLSLIRIGSSNNYKYFDGATWQSGSDIRDKVDIQPLSDGIGLDMIRELEPIIFRDNPRQAYGESILDYDESAHQKGTLASESYRLSFRAQDVAKFLDDNFGDECFNSIINHEIYYDEDTGKQDDKYFMSYAELVPFMFQAIKEQQTIIDEQEQRIARLESLVLKQNKGE